MTIGDSIIMLEDTTTSMADREIMFAPTLLYQEGCVYDWTFVSKTVKTK